MAGPETPAVRMRKADSADEDFHLLEELSKPLASLNAAQIALWVYRTDGAIREIVLAGHAEQQTCSSATSAVIEAAKRLDDSVAWMLTCGAAYFRVRGKTSGPSASPPVWGDPLGGMEGSQRILAEMVQNLTELSQETGLVQILERDWDDLEAFRRRYHRRSGQTQPQIALPDGDGPSLADYVPIVPARSPEGEPLVFHLEGWDFDCPAFQAVADRHLRRVRRELLKDALRRRARYRSWLKEWVERWAREMKHLRRPEVEQILLAVPDPLDQSGPRSQPTDVKTFFEKRLAEFLHSSQTWHEEVAYVYSQVPFAEVEAEDLDRKIRPAFVSVIDFERGISTKRSATADDEYTPRERITRNDPGLISTCLSYIRRMDAIIKPYENLRLWQRVADRQASPADRRSRDEHEAARVSEVSRQIVMETMIRGWPSFYLDDEEDQAVFGAWADEYRPHVWSIMAGQAQAAGVAVELLLEDNVVYDVRFDEDLGCTVQPLMLADNVSHAQVHAGGAGASAVVPLWPRRGHRAMPPEVLSAGSTNRQRAAALVEQARALASPSSGEASRAAACLRLAMGCHPGQAGKLILAEWSRRLGRDTAAEFGLASEIIYARELCGRLRFDEAETHLEDYLEDEPHPARNALAMAALCELMRQAGRETGGIEALAELKDKTARFMKLRDHLDKEAGKGIEEMTKSEFRSLVRNKPQVQQVLRELESLKLRIDRLGPQVETSEQCRCELVTRALASPASVAAELPALARAAREAPDPLRRLLDCQCRYVPADEEMARRYGDIDKVVEMRALFTLLHRLSSIRHRLGPADDPARLEAMGDLEHLAAEPWLPESSERDLRDLAEEFRKGNWDRLLANQIGYSLQESMSVCYTRIQDLLSDLMSNAVPLAEPLATRIHIAQTIDGKYLKALEMMLQARVGLGRALQHPWDVLNTELREMPTDGELEFDPRKRVISLRAGGRTVPLLRAPALADGEADYVAGIIDDPQTARRINPFAASLAEGILAVEVEPPLPWRLWRDAMQSAGRELLFTVALFGYDASPMPDYAPPKGKRGEDMERKLDQQSPRNAPGIDLEWTDLGEWDRFAGPDPFRVREASS